MNKNKIIALISAILATLFWGIHPIISQKLIAEQIDTLNIAAVRLFGAALFLFIFSKIFAPKNSEKKIIRKPIFFIGALFGFGLNFILFQKALEYSPAGIVTIYEAFTPFFVVLLGILFFRKDFSNVLQKKKLFLLLIITFLTSTGVALLFFDFNTKQNSSWFGNTLAFLSAVCFALYFIANSRVRKQNPETDSFVMTYNFLFFAGIIILPFVDWGNFMEMTLKHWLMLSFIVIFGTSLTYFLWTFAAKYLNVTLQSLLFNLTMIFTVIFDNFFGKLLITWQIVVSIFIVAISAFLVDKLLKEK